MTAAAHREQAIALMVERLADVPRRAEDYAVPLATAAEEYGCDGATLGALRDARLVRADGSGGERFAAHDLHYLGVRLGTARRYLFGFRLWRRWLEKLAAQGSTAVRVGYVAQVRVPTPGTVILPNGRRDLVLTPGQPSVEVDGVLRGAWPELPGDVAGVLRTLGTYEFCLLPHRLGRDTALARALRICDCATAACLVADECAELGHDVRVVQGLMIAVPLSTQHTWAEVRVDGVWTPVDPLMLATLHRFAGLDPMTWSVERSFGPMLLPIHVAPAPEPFVVNARGEAVPTTFLTRAEAQGAPA